MVKRYFVGGAGGYINRRRNPALVMEILGHYWLRGLHNHQRIAVVKEDNMNRKCNPYVSLAALLLLALILVLTCTGCISRAEAAETKPAKRYTYEVQNAGFGLDFYTITDTQTGNQYLFVYTGTTNGKAGGLTKLEE